MRGGGLHIIDDADKTPPPTPGRHPLAPIPGDAWERARPRYPAQVWVILTVIIVVIMAFILWGLYSLTQTMIDRYPWMVDTLGALLFGVLITAILIGMLYLIDLGRVKLLHARVIRTRHGVPVDVGAQLLINPLELERQTIALEMARAPYLQHPNLSTQSITNSQPPKVEALPPPEVLDVAPVLASTWLDWLNRVPHVMLAAETGGGKTTLATHILARRLKEPHATAYIIDPGASGWGGLPSVGGGEDWVAVKHAMLNVIDLYQARQKTRAEYLVRTGTELAHDHFPPMTVVMDEAFLARLNLGSGKQNAWDRFVPVLGSGARKVGVSVILLTQTANVEDLAISGPLRENYTRIALDSGAAIKFIQKQESNPERKRALLTAIQGMPYPAVTEQHGRCVLLDRSGMDRMPDLARWSHLMWLPPSNAPLSQEDDTRGMLARLKADGYTRDQARAAGVQFTNSEWGEV